MSDPSHDGELQDNQATDTEPQNLVVRAVTAILLPLTVALIVGVATGTAGILPDADVRPTAAPLLAALGITSWLLGLRWYGLRGLGLRGGRPLFAGIGFAVLGWVALLIVRWLPGIPVTSVNEAGQAVVETALLLEVVAIQSAGAGRVFIYLLLFEAFATQLWSFGLSFRSLAEWRGPLTAAVTSGFLFGALGFLLFRESFIPHWSSLLFFLTWGVLYGIIRLRTGSILGMVIVQALQSFTAWFVFQPPTNPDIRSFQMVYLIVSALYAILIWRLWPKEESDYRV